MDFFETNPNSLKFLNVFNIELLMEILINICYLCFIFTRVGLMSLHNGFFWDEPRFTEISKCFQHCIIDGNTNKHMLPLLDIIGVMST